MLPIKKSWLMPAGIACFVFAACGSDKSTDPTPSNDAYIVKSIAVDGQMADSFVYVNNQITETWAFVDNGEKIKTLYTYDNNGRVVLGKSTSTKSGSTIDSLVWQSDKAILYKQGFDNSGVNTRKDTLTLKVNGSGMMARIGYEDTVRRNDSKYLYYLEFTYTGNNVTGFHQHDFYTGLGPTIENDAKATLEYGQLINPLAPYLIKNPLLAYEMMDAYGPWLMSANNAVKITDTPAGELSATITSTPLAGSNVIQLSKAATAKDVSIYYFSLAKKP
ncbi:hypothetical protein [Chitinophaga sp. 212800010-3]|uniref:hypothetical protein n=1 Tax=unclassified Chitinophaga TaxID=2619133 RepID=UPI002DF0FF36|nr:hypothetical protein [Chitinophaga sp. 212800010-3]